MDLLCDKENCEKEATTRYAWPWGEEGFVCDDHRAHLESTAAQLGRTIAFSSLLAPPTPTAPASGSDLLEQLTAAHAELEATRAELERAQVANVALSHELGALKRGAPKQEDAHEPRASSSAGESHQRPRHGR